MLEPSSCSTEQINSILRASVDQRRTFKFQAADGRVFAFTAEDRFTLYGLVGVLLVRSREIVQVAMSCRVIGLDVETSVLAALMHLLGPGYLARTDETEVDMVARDLFARCGFSETAPGMWLRADAPPPSPASHLRIGFDDVPPA